MDTRKIIADEESYQCNTLSLIASDNYASRASLGCLGSVFNNKCAESYPGNRSYPGLSNFDIVEERTIDAAKKLFSCNYANVQAYSGSSANLGAMLAFVEPGDKILGLSIEQGGHYSHGSKLNISSKIFKSDFYYAVSLSRLPDAKSLHFEQLI